MHGPLAPAWQGDGTVITKWAGSGGAEAHGSRRRRASRRSRLAAHALRLDAGAGSLSAPMPVAATATRTAGRAGSCPSVSSTIPTSRGPAWIPTRTDCARAPLAQRQGDEVVLEGTAALDDDVRRHGRCSRTSACRETEPGRLGSTSSWSARRRPLGLDRRCAADASHCRGAYPAGDTHDAWHTSELHGGGRHEAVRSACIARSDRMLGLRRTVKRCDGRRALAIRVRLACLAGIVERPTYRLEIKPGEP
jgi:hypothetical protein